MADDEEAQQGPAEVFKLMFAFADTMALKCAVELRIPDIINKSGHPITIAQIADGLNSPCPDISCLSRIMRFLVSKKIFTAHTQDEGMPVLYGLSHAAKFLLRDTDLSLVQLVLMHTNDAFMDPWRYLAKCVEEGGNGFSKAHGMEFFEYASLHPEANELFNSAMGSTCKSFAKVLLSNYNGFNRVRSIVDVGGGTGTLIRDIVEAYPHIKGINFDLPHVVAAAPEYAGIVHVSGDMFDKIPHADVITMKMILHDWNDEDCVKILKNCYRAIPEKDGKVVIMEMLISPNEEGSGDDIGLISDLVMIAHTSGGKERTEAQWSKLLKDGGFPNYKIFHVKNFLSIIEAYPVNYEL